MKKMKKWKSETKGGYKILSIHGPNQQGVMVGCVENSMGYLHAVEWLGRGFGKAETATDWSKDIDELDLVPADPEIDYWHFMAEHGSIKSGGRLPDRRRTLKLGFDEDTGELLTAEVLKR